MANRLAGIATLTVDGQNYRLVGTLTYSPTIVTRETLKGQDAVHGYSEMPQAGFISGRFRDSSDLRISDFNAMTDVTVVAELANGKTVTGRNMWTVGEAQEVNTETSEFEVRWEGEDVTEY